MRELRLMKMYWITGLVTMFTILCQLSLGDEEATFLKENTIPYLNDASWKNLQLSRMINDEMIKMLDKEEIFEKMHDLFQYDKQNKKRLNDIKNIDLGGYLKENKILLERKLKNLDNEKNITDKVYRDTFADNILEFVDAKRKKRSIKDENNKSQQQKEVRVTGDTILHIRSEISDVIKSETDLYDILKNERQPQKKTAESYVDGIMIHPSKFIYAKEEKGYFSEAKAENMKKKYNETKRINSNDSNPPLENRRKNIEVPDDYDDSIKRKYGQVLKSKRELKYENFQSDAPYAKISQVEVTDSEVLSELNVKQMIECSLPSDATKITWHKDGEEVLMQGRMQLVRGKHILIVRVTRDDEGRWICSGRDQHGSLLRSEPINLVVLEPPSPPYLEVFGRRLDPSNLFLPVKEGSELKLSCKSEGGRPLATLHWDPAPSELYLLDEQNQEIEGASSNAILVVRRDHHNISISCVAVHPALEDPMIASTLLHVQYAPRFSISRIPGFGFPLAEGSAVALKCEVDSNPLSPPRWRKDEMDPPVPQSDDGFLNFTSVLREHSGWYKCTANHPLGNYSSIGYFLNVRYEVDEVTKLSTDIQQSATKEKVEVALGGAVQLQCPPESFGCWGRPESRMEVGTPPGISREPPLVARGMLYQEADQYKCKGITKHEAERLKLLRDANMIIQDGPSVRPNNETIIVKEGESVLLQVEVCSSPPPTKLIWLTPDRLLHVGSSYGNITAYNITDSSRPECVWARLTVEDTNILHTGEYSLVARSMYGLSEALLHLTVQPNISAASASLPKVVTAAAASNFCFQLNVLPIMVSLLYF